MQFVRPHKKVEDKFYTHITECGKYVRVVDENIALKPDKAVIAIRNHCGAETIMEVYKQPYDTFRESLSNQTTIRRTIQANVEPVGLLAVPIATTKMNIQEAIIMYNQGFSVAREAWADAEISTSLTAKVGKDLLYYTNNGLTLSIDDIMGQDWYLANDGDNSVGRIGASEIDDLILQISRLNLDEHEFKNVFCVENLIKLTTQIDYDPEIEKLPLSDIQKLILHYYTGTLGDIQGRFQMPAVVYVENASTDTTNIPTGSGIKPTDIPDVPEPVVNKAQKLFAKLNFIDQRAGQAYYQIYDFSFDVANTSYDNQHIENAIKWLVDSRFNLKLLEEGSEFANNLDRLLARYPNFAVDTMREIVDKQKQYGSHNDPYTGDILQRLLKSAEDKYNIYSILCEMYSGDDIIEAAVKFYKTVLEMDVDTYILKNKDVPELDNYDIEKIMEKCGFSNECLEAIAIYNNGINTDSWFIIMAALLPRTMNKIDKYMAEVEPNPRKILDKCRMKGEQFLLYNNLIITPTQIDWLEVQLEWYHHKLYDWFVSHITNELLRREVYEDKFIEIFFNTLVIYNSRVDFLGLDKAMVAEDE